MPTIRKFETAFRGYDRFQVNKFVDEVIAQMEELVAQVEAYERKTRDLDRRLREQKMHEDSLNKAISAVEDSSQEVKTLAEKEGRLIIDEAKRNANRIINDALLRAQRTEIEVANLRKNVTVFKAKIKSIIESQLEIVQDIDQDNMNIAG